MTPVSNSPPDRHQIHLHDQQQSSQPHQLYQIDRQHKQFGSQRLKPLRQVRFKNRKIPLIDRRDGTLHISSEWLAKKGQGVQ
jgi:hypothetical protein